MRRREIRRRIVSVALCPVVLGMLAFEPRPVGAVARELARRGLDAGLPAHQAASVTLDRLQRDGLVYGRAAPRDQRVFRVTARGRRELAFHSTIARMLARA